MSEKNELACALARVLSKVERVAKNGRNEFHKYDYVTESDLVDGVRELLAEEGVAIFPSVEEHTTEEVTNSRNKTEYLATVTLHITLIHGDSGDTMVTKWVGQGIDAGDKGYYKAYTGAMKYFLLKTFLISTGDDPEQDSPQVEKRGGGGQTKRPRSPAPTNSKSTPKASSKQAPEAPSLAEVERELSAIVNEDVKERFLAALAKKGGVEVANLPSTTRSWVRDKIKGLGKFERAKWIESFAGGAA